MRRITDPGALEKLRATLRDSRDPTKPVITICGGTGCRASGSREIVAAFKEEIGNRNLEEKIDVRTTGCHGFCEQGPIVVIYPGRIFYPMVKTEDVSRIISETVLNDRIIDELLYIDPISGERIAHENEVLFYLKQIRLVCRHF